MGVVVQHNGCVSGGASQHGYLSNVQDAKLHGLWPQGEEGASKEDHYYQKEHHAHEGLRALESPHIAGSMRRRGRHGEKRLCMIAVKVQTIKAEGGDVQSIFLEALWCHQVECQCGGRGVHYNTRYKHAGIQASVDKGPIQLGVACEECYVPAPVCHTV